jgi:hypothetical protein
MDPEQQSAIDLEREQEEKLKKKYGALTKKAPLLKKVHNHGPGGERAFFDSAEWELRKQTGRGPNPLEPETEDGLLPPRLEPTPHHPLPARRPSEDKAT